MYFMYGIMARNCGVGFIFKATQSRDRHVLNVRNIGDVTAFKYNTKLRATESDVKQ
jgi:hypothetical protein